MAVTGLTSGSIIPPGGNNVGSLSDLTEIKNQLANLVVGMNSQNMTQTWEQFSTLNAKMETLINTLPHPDKENQRNNMTQLQIAIGGIKQSTEKFNNTINDPTKYSFSSNDLQLLLQDYKTAKECIQKIGRPSDTTAIDSASQKPFEFFSSQIHSIISNIQTTLDDKDQTISDSISSMEEWAGQTWDQDQTEYAESEKTGIQPRQDDINKITNSSKTLKNDIEKLKNIAMILYPKDTNLGSALDSMLEPVKALKELAENNPRDHSAVDWESNYTPLKDYKNADSPFNILNNYPWEG